MAPVELKGIVVIICTVTFGLLMGPSAIGASPNTNAQSPVLFHYTSELVEENSVTDQPIVDLQDEPLLASKNTSLYMCSLYKFTFTVHNENSLSTIIKIIRTPEVNPKSKIQLASPGGKSIELVWETDYPECVHHYSIQIKDSLKWNIEFLVQNGSSFEITGLTPCTLFDITLNTFGRNGLESDSGTVQEKTTLANLDLDGFNYSFVNANTVFFNWTTISEVENCDGDFFVKLVAADGLQVLEEHVPYTSNEITISGLRSCYDYNVTLNANYFDILASIEDFSTPFERPSNIHRLEFDPREQRLSWQEPKENPNCVANYTVVFGNVDNRTTSDTEIQLNNWPRCRLMVISVAMVDKEENVQFEPLSTELVLESDVLSWDLNPTYYLVDDNSSLEIVWMVPVLRDHCEIQFDLVYDDEILIRDRSFTDNRQTIKNFEFCQSHRIELELKYKNESTITHETAFFGAESALSVQNITYVYDELSESVVVNWKKPKQYENCQFTYIIATDDYQTQVSEETFSVAWEKKEINIDISIKRETLGRNPSSGVTITNPFPTVTNIKHEIREDGQVIVTWKKPVTSLEIVNYVLVWNREVHTVKKTSFTTDSFPKCQEIELVIYVQFKDDVSGNATYTFTEAFAPSPVINVVHRYKHPAYILSWDLSSTNPDCYSEFLVSHSQQHQPASVTTNQFEISDWLDDTDYEFEIVAQFNAEYKSDPVTHSFRTPGPVKSLLMKENAAEEADLSWILEAPTDHVPVNYTIAINEENYTTPHNHISVPVAFCVDLDIVITVRYDTGVVRSASFSKRLVKVPGAVRNIKMGIYQDVIRTRWDMPEEHANCANSFKVQVNEGSELLVNTQQFDVSVWQPCTELTVTVSAINTDSIAGPESSRSMQTPEMSISEVSNLNVETTDKTLRINWDEPIVAAKCVTGYRVVIRETDTSTIIHEHVNSTMFMVLEEMKSCQKLTVQVTPIGQRFANGTMKDLDTTIKERSPGQLTPLQLIEAQIRNIHLQTTFDDASYLCPLSVVVITCKNSDGTESDTELKLNELVPVKVEVLEITIGSLKPYESYSCFARIQNTYGSWSNPSFEASFTTLEDLSGPPNGLQIVERAHDTLKFGWKNPLKPNGKITHYEIRVDEVKQLYFVPDDCQEKLVKLSINTTVVGQEFNLETVKPYTLYAISVRAVNGAGGGIFGTLTEKTDPHIPHPPETLQLIDVRGPFDTDEFNSSARLSWKFPCSVCGDFERFVGVLTEVDSESAVKIIEFEKTDVRDEYQVEFVGLKASSKFKVDLVTVTTGFSSPPMSVEFNSPAAIPDFFKLLQVSWDMGTNPSQSALLTVSRSLVLSSGNILYYAIMISEMDCQPDPEAKRVLMNIKNDWPTVLNWADVQEDSCQRQYQATPMRFANGLFDLKVASAPGADNDQMELQIGGSACTDTNEGFCNGPLKPGTKYAVVLRLFTETGFTDNPHLIMETISEVQFTMIILMVITVLTTAFVAGTIIVLNKKSRLDTAGTESLTDSASNTKKLSGGEILTKNFTEHLEDLSKNNCERLNMEFNIINSGCQTTECSVAKENGTKNRYTNVLPYDFNRVVLDANDDPAGCDYINASFIDGYRKPQEYIACQGPKMESTYDFWRMLLQYKVRSVVMLTSYQEGSKDKCYEYFPCDSPQNLKFHEITIRCKKVFDFPTHKKRILTIERNNTCHTVHHYHFLLWPDHSCPSDPNDLIEFTRIVSERSQNSGPVVVHCSAGVGRTGTYLAIDIARQQLRSEKTINVCAIVKELRRQRMKMVNSFSQYLLIYQCIAILLDQYKSATEPMWKKLTRKSMFRTGKDQLIGESGPSMVQFKTHNFGMLPLSSIDKRGARALPELDQCTTTTNLDEEPEVTVIRSEFDSNPIAPHEIIS